jgi:hypothetical protein
MSRIGPRFLAKVTSRQENVVAAKWDFVRHTENTFDEQGLPVGKKGEPVVAGYKFGVPVFQAIALRNIGADVKAGDLSGLFADPKTLPHDDDSWVYQGGVAGPGTRLKGKARLYGEAVESRIMGQVGPGALVERSTVDGIVGAGANVINCNITPTGSVGENYFVCNLKVVDRIPPGVRTLKDPYNTRGKGQMLLPPEILPTISPVEEPSKPGKILDMLLPKTRVEGRHVPL